MVGAAVDAVAEAHEPAPRAELALEPRPDLVRRADRVDHVEDRSRRAAVERPLERAEGGDEEAEEIKSGISQMRERASKQFRERFKERFK